MTYDLINPEDIGPEYRALMGKHDPGMALVLNALTFQAYDELRRAFYALSGEADVRVVIITGSGRGGASVPAATWRTSSERSSARLPGSAGVHAHDV